MMNFKDIIEKKRDGGKLTSEEIAFFVEGYTKGEIPDYQASAFLMAVFFQHMDDEETFTLTECMKNSGDIVDLSGIKGIKVDKHSTGGVGDKITLIVGPIAAACGVPVAKMSGRGLGFTGGTIDKLESIPGFNTTLEPEDFHKQVNEIGIALIGQSGHIAPADKKIYALRDVTATVANLSLISSSIMSKKLAAGSDAILLDVKCGKGAFMETVEDAKALAEIMCRIGNNAGKRTVAVITDMSQPLGSAVGNSLEVQEALNVLQGQKNPEDVVELSLYLAGIMIYLGGKAETAEEGRRMAEEAISSGAAYEKFKELVERQGGDPSSVEGERIGDTQVYNKLPISSYQEKVIAEKAGFIVEINAGAVGNASQGTGAGRATKEDPIDPGAGILVLAKVGDYVEEGQTLAICYSNEEAKAKEAAGEVAQAYIIGEEEPEKPKLIKATIGL